MPDLIERAEAMAERLDIGEIVSVQPDGWITLNEVRRAATPDARKAAALIRELIAQVKAGEGMP